MQVVWIARHRHIGDAFFDADAAQFLQEQLQSSRGEQVRCCVVAYAVEAPAHDLHVESHLHALIAEGSPCLKGCVQLCARILR